MIAVLPPSTGKSLTMASILRTVILQDTPLDRLTVYFHELTIARDLDAKAGVTRRFTPEARACLATDWVFTLARRGRSALEPVVGRDSVAEANDETLQAIREGSRVRRILRLAAAANAFEVIVRLANVDGIPKGLRAEIRSLLEIALVHEAL